MPRRNSSYSRQTERFPGFPSDSSRFRRCSWQCSAVPHTPRRSRGDTPMRHGVLGAVPSPVHDAVPLRPPGSGEGPFPRFGVPGTPHLTAWANSGKSGRASGEQALRRMAIRQARLERLALSASGHERMVNGGAAASEEKRIDFSAGVAWFGDILNIEGAVRRDWTPFGL